MTLHLYSPSINCVADYRANLLLYPFGKRKGDKWINQTSFFLEEIFSANEKLWKSCLRDRIRKGKYFSRKTIKVL